MTVCVYELILLITVHCRGAGCSSMRIRVRGTRWSPVFFVSGVPSFAGIRGILLMYVKWLSGGR